MSANRFRELMQNLYVTHREFKKEWATWERVGLNGKEPKEVTLTRDKFWDSLNILFGIKIEPLHDAFLADSISAINDVIDFLEIDIPAFRCGYEKEWYLRRLKSLPLNEMQKKRLKTIALDLCRKPDYRREFTDWARLLVMLADDTFIAQLQSLLKSPDEFVRKKNERMLSMIIENRKDLKAMSLVSA